MAGPGGPDGPSRRKPRLHGLRPPEPSRRGGRLPLLCKSLKDSLPLQQAPRGFGGLSALLEPAHDFVAVDLDHHGVGHRIVVPEVLDKPAVARRARARHHEAVERVLFGPHPPQPDLYQPAPPFPNSCGRPTALPLRLTAPNCLASFCIASRAFNTRLTSAGSTPLPRAIRLLRAPSMTSGCARSRLVIDRMIASIFLTSRSVSWPASWPLSAPPPGIMSSTLSSDPMLLTCFIWASMSSKVTSPARRRFSTSTALSLSAVRS